MTGTIHSGNQWGIPHLSHAYVVPPTPTGHTNPKPPVVIPDIPYTVGGGLDKRGVQLQPDPDGPTGTKLLIH